MQLRTLFAMSVSTSTRPIVLVAVPSGSSLASELADHEYAVVEIHSGALATAYAQDLQPDLILVATPLPDMSGIDACRFLQEDVRIRHTVPIVILTRHPPAPEQRAAAVRAGAWDILVHPGDPQGLWLKLQTYVIAKRNLDLALAGGLVDPTTGVYSRPALARRARELGALMSRDHGALACVVLEMEGGQGSPEAGSLVVRAIRVSDMVGAWSPTQIAVLAPATSPTGAVKLAQRAATALGVATGPGRLVPGSTLRAGYEAVSNFTYLPIDPVELLTRAAAAVHSGAPDPLVPWVRGCDAGKPADRGSELPAHAAPSGAASEKRRTSS